MSVHRSDKLIYRLTSPRQASHKDFLLFGCMGKPSWFEFRNLRNINIFKDFASNEKVYGI